MNIMELIQPQSLKNSHWLVVPCRSKAAFGVPLFAYVDEKGCVVETAISPLEGAHERCDRLAESLAGIQERPSLCSLLDRELIDVPQAVADSLRAHLTHKRITPHGHGELEPVDPAAGIVRTKAGDVPALLVGLHRGSLGLLCVEQANHAACIRVMWAAQTDFRTNQKAFAAACMGIGHHDLLQGYETSARELAIDGVGLLLKDKTRCIPNLVSGAFISKIIAGLPTMDIAYQKGQRLLRAVEHVEQPMSEQAYAQFATIMGEIGRYVALAAQKRKPGAEQLYDNLVNTPAWLAVCDRIVDETVALCAMLDAGITPGIDQVKAAIEHVATSTTDLYTLAMTSHQGRKMSGLGELWTQNRRQVKGEGEIEARIRLYVWLLGESGWQVARPFEYGLISLLVSQ